MKRLGLALFLFVAVRYSLFAISGAHPCIFKIENLTTKVQEASITYQIPGNLVQDNVSMDIFAYVVIPVGCLFDSDNAEAEGKKTFHGDRYCFRFSDIHNTKRYTIREDMGDLIIAPPIIINPHTSSNGSSPSVARLCDGFGNLKKTVFGDNSGQIHIYVGDLEQRLYLLKLTIDGIEFTEKIVI